jgi:hypothetical protein
MAKEMQTYNFDRLRAMQTQVVEQPRELCELTARIERLRERLADVPGSGVRGIF